jgi:FtsX-like permease family
VISPSYRIGLHGASESQQALQQLLAMCAADPGCNGAFPSLATELDAVLTRFAKAPAAVSIPTNPASLSVTITRTVFVRQLFQLLHFREDWAVLPLAIHHAAANDFTPFAVLAVEREASRNPHADGMALSVACAQDAPSITSASLATATKGTFLRTDRGQYLTRACSVWPHAAQEKIATTPVTAPTPALYLLWGGVIFVLLIGCLNLANLVMVRAGARRREMATRYAIGGAFSRLARQIVTETMLLAVCGGGFGVLGGWWVLRSIRSIDLDKLPRRIRGRSRSARAGRGVVCGDRHWLRAWRPTGAREQADGSLGGASTR